MKDITCLPYMLSFLYGKSLFLWPCLFCLFVHLSPTHSWHARGRVRARTLTHTCADASVGEVNKKPNVIGVSQKSAIKNTILTPPTWGRGEIARFRSSCGFSSWFLLSEVRSGNQGSTPRDDRTRSKDPYGSWRHIEWRGLNSPLDFPLFGLLRGINRRWGEWEWASHEGWALRCITAARWRITEYKQCAPYSK